MGTAALAFAAAGCSAESALPSAGTEKSAAADSEAPVMVPLAVAPDAPSFADSMASTQADGPPATSRPEPEYETAGPPQATAAPNKAAPAEPRPDRHAWRDLD
ncbi:hypothetical protein CDQ92_08610 [Sphingopyxis bauzanensis]|uniref:Uncharacterized protein n=1 Tax=Sphingopyxis bauzanensis TaxID=651663 RepID=A0A246JVM4_9SPHN|nr:hypothetical protein CDQ92_08610 [Sphingopyxis bauzanensis]GGJ40738.1 hypothetical protein GCM10011393_08630 [Sphingopyxis bauzanensis]